jgi:hypothetical protein
MFDYLNEEDTKLEKFLTKIHFYTIKSFFYNLYWYKIRQTVFKIFRKNHLSDLELWNPYVYIAKRALPLLQAYRNSERHGYPSAFSEWDENAMTKEKYEEYKNLPEYDAQKIYGGGPEAWDKVLDEMIFALEYAVYESNGKKKKEDYFYKKYYGKTPHDETEENKIVTRHYKKLDEEGNPRSGTIMDSNDREEYKDTTKYKFLGEDVWYYDMKMTMEAGQRAHLGILKFAEFFYGLWD